MIRTRHNQQFQPTLAPMTSPTRGAAPLYPNAPLSFTLLLIVAAVGFYPSYFSVLGETDAAHHLPRAVG